MTDQELLDWIMTEPPIIELIVKVNAVIEKKNRWRRACELACEHGGYYLDPDHLYIDAGKNNEQIKSD